MNDPLEGETYKISHLTKGVFIGKIISQDINFVLVQLICGKAKGFKKFNHGHNGQIIKLRKNLIKNYIKLKKL